MKTFGVVAEFNPFHEGHAYLIEQVKKLTGAGACVAAMSGDFVQRGEPAFFDKWTRAELAVKGGADLVIEIPAAFSTASASYFAKGGVGVLDALGCLDHLAFGSECGDPDALKAVADVLCFRAGEIKQLTSEGVRRGATYPAARARAVEALASRDRGGNDRSEETGSSALSMPEGPNDILAVEYLSELKKSGSTMKPVAVRRSGDSHHSSASAVRRRLREEDPSKFEERDRILFALIASKVLSSSEEELSEIASAGAGLAEKLKKEIRKAASLEELIELVKSKAFTRTRISRLMIQTLLGTKREDLKSGPCYIRVLAMNEKGSSLLKKADKEGTLKLPVISNLSKERAHLEHDERVKDASAFRRSIDTDILASDLYNIITGSDLYRESDFVRSPRIAR